MAFSADTGEFKATRGDLFAVDPRALIVDYRKNLSRKGIEPPVDDELMQLGRSMMPKAKGGNGQEQPIKVRPRQDRKLEVVMGWRRTRAALWLIESGECPDFQIQYIVSRVSDQEAALDNLVENLDRLAPKPIEMAHAIRTLEESYLLTVEQIAEKLGRSVQWVVNTLDLVMLPEPIQAAVAAEDLSAAAAKEFGDMPAREAVETFNALRDSGEKISATTVKDAKRAKREKALANGDMSPEAAAPVKRSLRHVKAFLEGCAGSGQHKDGKALAELLIDFIGGEKTEDQLQTRWDKLFPPPVKRASAKKTASKTKTKAAKATVTV